MMAIPEFIAKWRKVELKERSAAQEHFIDLCKVFEHPTSTVCAPKPEEPVHENIRIIDNHLDGAGVSAKNVKGLTMKGNSSPDGSIPIHLDPSCTDTQVENHQSRE